MIKPIQCAINKIDELLINEHWEDPIPWLYIIDALEKSSRQATLSQDEIMLVIKGLVFTINQFPFAESTWIDKYHYIKSEIEGLNLYYTNGHENLLLRNTTFVCTVAIINKDRTGWELC